MKKLKIKYNRNAIRLWLFQVVLFFSVFAFSGFNENVEASFQEAEKLELVESSISNPDFNLHNYSRLSFTKFVSAINLFDFSPLFSFNQIITAKYKTIQKENLTYRFLLKKISIKTFHCSSKDDLPHSF